MVDDAGIDRDVATIASLLKQQALWASDERKIVAIFTRYQGTPGLAKLIQKLKGKVLVRATARSAWQDTWVNAWDTLFYELEDSRWRRSSRSCAPPVRRPPIPRTSGRRSPSRRRSA